MTQCSANSPALSRVPPGLDRVLRLEMACLLAATLGSSVACADQPLQATQSPEPNAKSSAGNQAVGIDSNPKAAPGRGDAPVQHPKRKQNEALSAAALDQAICRRTPSGTYPTLQRDPPLDVAAIDANCAGLQVFRKVLQRDPKAATVLFSPWTLYTALLALREGASGQTLRELDLFLGDRLTTEERRQATKALRERLHAENPKAHVEAIHVFVRPGLPIVPKFRKVLKSVYDGTLVSTPFAKPLQAISVMNRELKRATGGQIVEFFAQPLPNFVQLVVTSAIAMNSGWAFPFDSSQTRVQGFQLTPDERVKVPFLRGRIASSVVEAPTYTTVAVPLSARGWMTWLVLPHEGVTMQTVAEELSQGAMMRWREAATTAEVELEVPKIHAASSAWLPLLSVLNELGMVSMNEFSALSSVGLKLDSIDQKTHLELHERGVAVRSVTRAVMIKVGAPEPSPAVSVVFDRPFFVLVTDEQSGLVFMIGQIGDPR